MEKVDGGSTTTVASNIRNFHLDVVADHILEYLDKELERRLDGLGGFLSRMARYIYVEAVILDCPVPALVKASLANELDKMILIFL